MATNTGTLTLNGVERPYQVNTIRQTKAFTEAVGVELHAMQEKLQELQTKSVLDAMDLFTAYAWSALYAGAMQTDKHCAFTLADVDEWVQNGDLADTIQEIVKPLLTLSEVLAEKKS